jgi:hypothetical protein
MRTPLVRCFFALSPISTNASRQGEVHFVIWLTSSVVHPSHDARLRVKFSGWISLMDEKSTHALMMVASLAIIGACIWLVH